MTKRKRRPSGASQRWTSETLSEWGLSDFQQRILLGVGSVVAVLASACGLTLAVNAIGGEDAVPHIAAADSLGQARPDDYQGWPSLKQFAPIADRKADARPLTAQEIFTAKTLRTGRVTLKRAEVSLDAGCSGVVWGAELAEELAKAGCTQAVRGLFASSDGTYVAQYTLLDLSGVQAANGLVEALNTLHRGGWVMPLPSQKAVFRGYTEASGHAMGHYVGLVWIGRTDGAEPSPRDDFVTLALTVRESEKAVYRRVVAVAGVPPVPTQGSSGTDTAQPSEPAPTQK